ncbi:MAG: N-acetylmuramoyl-L-alanine amidase [Actinomycetota bacterium]|nr:N-acetylmuramoyl-L-alanine amidase [Actinomycetota bacterium]
MKTAAAALAAVTAAAVSLPPPAGAGGSAPAPHRADGAVQAHVLPLGAAHGLQPVPGGVRSAPLVTRPYTMVALTWRGAATPEVEVRTRTEGTWTDWHDLHLLTGPAADRSGTELLWAGRSDGVQVRLDGDAGRRTRIHLVDSATLPADVRSAGGRVGEAPSPDTVDATEAPQPQLRSRGDWGADESWRSGAPVYNETIKQAHVHHTATSGTYTRSEVPALIRGLYFYHTQVLGWSDLGYNFVVDRFGRIWEGRAGGVDRAVRGAHTLGFNHASFGVAALGEYDHTRPSPELLRGLVRLSAWKLDAYDREPAGYARVRSEGSDRYPEGQWVRLPVIDGHRDTNETACPGERLYAELPEIRRRAQQRVDAVFTGSPSMLR